MSSYAPVMILNNLGAEIDLEEERVRYTVEKPCEIVDDYEIQDWGPKHEDSEEDEVVVTVAHCSTEESATLVCFALNLLNAAQKRANARGNP